jgi:hypothetical protein
MAAASGPALRELRIGGGRVERAGPRWRLAIGPASARGYTDAQLDDYGGLKGRQLAWRPPLRLSVRARLSPGARGTAGFGFWNNPFSPAGGLPRLPDAVWFFYASEPSDMALVPGVPGRGWKAGVVHAARPGAIAWGLPVAAAIAWGRLTGRAARAGRWLQRLTGAAERLVAVDPAEWHDYTLAWEPAAVVFAVDGRELLRAPEPPRGPLGFVTWIDNQYARANPRGELGWALLDVAAEQVLELEGLAIETAGARPAGANGAARDEAARDEAARYEAARGGPG